MVKSWVVLRVKEAEAFDNKHIKFLLPLTYHNTIVSQNNKYGDRFASQTHGRNVWTSTIR